MNDETKQEQTCKHPRGIIFGSRIYGGGAVTIGRCEVCNEYLKDPKYTDGNHPPKGWKWLGFSGVIR